MIIIDKSSQITLYLIMFTILIFIIDYKSQRIIVVNLESKISFYK